MNKHQYNPACPFQIIEVGGLPCSISTQDFERVIHYNWYINAQGYVVHGQNLRIHHLVLGLTDFSEIEVHHKDGNKLNNTRENLQVLSFSDHQVTRSKQSNNLSGYKGVSWKNPQGNRKGTWVAQISQNKKKIHIGRFKTPEDAAKAYDKKAKELYGEVAFLNFPYE